MLETALTQSCSSTIEMPHDPCSLHVNATAGLKATMLPMCNGTGHLSGTRVRSAHITQTLPHWLQSLPERSSLCFSLGSISRRPSMSPYIHASLASQPLCGSRRLCKCPPYDCVC